VIPAQRGVSPESDARGIAREFRTLLERGVRIRAAGTARGDPAELLPTYLPKHAIRLFDTTYYLTDLREDRTWEGTMRFFAAWVLPTREAREVYPRLFEKDYSLVWRSPSHYIRSARENWMGKGEVRWVIEDGVEMLATFEETTNLPLEIQGALDALASRCPRPRSDPRAVERILRRAPDHRIEPYEDFVAPRRRARSDPRNLVHGGRDVAWFSRANDPTSLRFARGFEPDFARGVVEQSRTHSRFYGGAIRKVRILSRNRRIQYQFVAAPRHAWIIPPQTLTREIASYGVRTIDVHVAEALCIPGYEYCFVDESTRPPTRHSQIPEGFAGAPSDLDPARLDASAWIERMPVIREFRRQVLRQRVSRQAGRRAAISGRAAGRERAGASRSRSAPGSC
jgi:hypothetical protein